MYTQIITQRFPQCFAVTEGRPGDFGAHALAHVSWYSRRLHEYMIMASFSKTKAHVVLEDRCHNVWRGHWLVSLDLFEPQ